MCIPEKFNKCAKGREVEEESLYIRDNFGVDRPPPDNLRREAGRYARRADPEEVVSKDVQFM